MYIYIYIYIYKYIIYTIYNIYNIYIYIYVTICNEITKISGTVKEVVSIYKKQVIFVVPKFS